MPLKSINTVQGLYVIEQGKYLSTLGFDYAFKCASDVYDWLQSENSPCETPDASLQGTEDGYEQYRRIMDIGFEFYSSTGKRCNAELVPSLVGLEGKRVEVVDRWNEKRRFIVAKSSGWMPCHIELRTRRSTGGIPVCGAPFKSLRVIKERKAKQ